MNIGKSEEMSFKLLIDEAKERNPVPNDRKVIPLEETQAKEIEMKLRNGVKRPIDRDEIASIMVSNEDLQELYEKKKKFKKREEVYHFQNAHRGEVKSIAFDRYGKYIISGSSDASIKIFDFNTKQLVHHFENAHEQGINSVAVTTEFIISSSAYSIKVFDLSDKELVHEFENTTKNKIVRMAVTHDEEFIISGYNDGSINIFELSSLKQVCEFKKVHNGWVTAIAVPRSNEYFVSGSTDKSIKMFDLSTKQLIHHFENAHQGEINSMAITFNNQFLISGSADKSLKVFDLNTKQLIHHFEDAHEDGITSVAVTSDNNYIFSGSTDKSLKIFDLKTKQLVHHLQNVHERGISSLAVTQNNYIISGSADKSLKVFGLRIEQYVHNFEKAHEGRVTSVVVTSDNKYIISGCSDGSNKSIKVFDLDTKQLIHHFENVHEDGITSLAVTFDNKYVISGSGQAIKVFELSTSQQVQYFQNAHEGEITSMAVTPDSKSIISGSTDKSIKVFDLSTKQLIHHFENAHEGEISSMAVTSNNQFLISGSADKSLKLFDLNTKQLIHHFENVHQDGIASVAVDPENKYVISGSGQFLKVFDLKTKQLIHHLESANYGEIISVAITSDCKYIISAGGSYINVFDLCIGQQVNHFRNLNGRTFGSMAVTSDSKYVIAGTERGTIDVFQFKTKQTLPPEDSKKQVISHPYEKASLLIPNPGVFDEEFYFIYGERKEFSIFNSVDDFLWKKSLEYSVSEAVKHPEMFVLPFRWNLLHIVSVFDKDDFIARMPNYPQFKMPFLLDAFDRTPFHYLVAHQNVKSTTINILFGYICDYLEDCQLRNPFEFQRIIQSLSSLLSFIFEKIEIKLRQRFLTIIYAESSLPYNNPAPIFGNVLSEFAAFNESPVLTQETRAEIWDEQGTSQVEFRSNYLNLDYNILSQDMQELVDSLKTQTSQEIFKLPAITKLIDHLWAQAETPLTIFFAFYSAFIIALSVYLTWSDRCLPYEIALLASSALLTANELWQIYNLRKSYLESFLNWFDLAHLLLTIAFLGTRISDNDNELARAWMSTLIIILGYLRWISLLKTFSPTRHLIQVVITIVNDMLSFIIVIALIVIGFSIIFLVFNREAGYGDYLYEAYNVMYGPVDIDGEAAWQFSQKLLMAVLAFFLNVVLLNMLISIMGDSYGQVLEMRDKTDALTRLEMISEAVIYRRFFSSSYETKRGYLVYCLPVELGEEETDQNAKLGNIMNNIMNIIQQNHELKQQNNELKQQNDESKQQQILMKNEISAVRNEVKNEVSTIQNEVLNMKEMILNEFLKLKASPLNNQ